MSSGTNGLAEILRAELAARNRIWARGRPHVESYGGDSVVVYAPEAGRHGNFFDAAYAAIETEPTWRKRFDKIHAQGRSLPNAENGRRWREIDSSVSSDALLMNIFCTPEVTESESVRSMLGVESDARLEFGWKAKVPLASGRFDRTEVDLRWGDLLVEAKLTETDFQTRATAMVKSYRDFGDVFDADLLPRVELRTTRRRSAVEFAESFTQEWEEAGDEEAAREFQATLVADARTEEPFEPGFAGYQLIRNVLAAHTTGGRFCVVHDARRPDLREKWFDVMVAVKSAELRTRLAVLTWQELVTVLPEALRHFLDRKYGIAAAGQTATAIEDLGKSA
jgi:Restriction Endonuclease associating with ARP